MILLKTIIMVITIVLGFPIVLCGIVGGAIHHSFLVGVTVYYSFAEWCMYDKKVKENEAKKG